MRSWLPIAPRRFAVTIAVVIVVFTASRSVSARICESTLKADYGDALSSLLEDSVPPTAPNSAFRERPSQIECDSFNDTECAMSHPEGAPQPARGFEFGKSRLALASDTALRFVPPSRRISGASEKTANSSEYCAEIFRPPRRS